MTLYSLALSALLAVSGAGEETRLQALAADIALAVDLGAEPFKGEAAREAAALALVAIGWGESGYRAEVGDCRVAGDRGRSISYWQIMRGPNWAGSSRGDICGNNSLAALLALRAYAMHARPARTHLGAFYGYASGNAARASKAGRRHCLRWERLARKAGLVASCWNRAPITFAPVSP